MLEQDGKPALLRPRSCDDEKENPARNEITPRAMFVHLLLAPLMLISRMIRGAPMQVSSLAGTLSDPVSDVPN